MRALAAALLALACTWGGFALAGKLTRRVRALEKIVSQLKLLRNRVVYLAMPLPQALQQCGGAFALAAGNIERGWEEAFALAFEGQSVSRQDTDLLAQSVGIMASMTRQDSQDVCDGAVQAMQLRLEEAKETAQRNGRLYRALGACVGLAGAILMI